jgi:hypothetical protein
MSLFLWNGSINLDPTSNHYHTAQKQAPFQERCEQVWMRHYRQNCVLSVRLRLLLKPGIDSQLKYDYTHQQASLSKMSPTFLFTVIIVLGFVSFGRPAKRREDKTKCPHVKAIRNFDLHEVIVRSQFSSRTCETSIKSIRLWCSGHAKDSKFLNREIEISSRVLLAACLLLYTWFASNNGQCPTRYYF